MNPKSLCRFACEQYKKDCPHAATDTTTIYENKTAGVNCDNLDLKEHYGIDIPEPYYLSNDKKQQGVFKKNINVTKDKDNEERIIENYHPICRNPVWIEKSFIDPHTEEHYMQIMAVIKNNMVDKIVSQMDVLTAAGIKGLTKYGLNVPEKNARDLEEFFSICMDESKSITEEEISSRFGWSVDNTAFVIGQQKIFVDNIKSAYLTSDVNQETYKPYKPNGSPEAWLNNANGLLQHDNVRFVCYGACASVLLKILSGSSFIVELVADTSKGKTVMAELAMSIFGNPEQLKMATAVTNVFLERTCAVCNDLPIFLDETSMIKTEFLKEMTYMVANERGKGRGKKEGGVNEVDRWKTVVLTTGEVPLTNTSSLGGQNVRIVSLYGGIGGFDPQNVGYFKEHKEENCGTIAPLIIQKILDEKEDLQKYYNELKDALKIHSESDKSGVMGRVVDTYALISLAGFIFESVVEDLGGEDKDALKLVENKFCEKLTNSDGSLPDRAFSIISDWIMENKKCFCSEKDGYAGDRYDLYGNIAMAHPDNEAPYDYVDIIPKRFYDVLDAALEHKGISKRILSDWKASGKIVPDKDGKNTISATIKTGTKQTRVIRLKMPLPTMDVI